MRVLINPYLNAAPLWWALREAPPPGWALEEAVPSAAVRSLEAGECDIALVSAVALLSLPGVKALHGWGVAAAGAVESVVLVRKSPIENLRTIGIDGASRSGRALLEVLCRRRWGISPAFVPVDDLPVALLELDAVMAIGDKTFGLGRGMAREDLAQAWHDWTGLPFLFAAWAARGAAAGEETAARLAASGEAGIARLPEIAAAYAKSLKINGPRLEQYLSHRVYHRLADKEWAGLERFAREARGCGVIPDPRTPEFFG